jgi:AcrR family transcriptional regulator
MAPSSKTVHESSGLRSPIIEAARKVLIKEGYDRLSMRRVAQEAGCSTMALYRHFANKEALTQFLCAELYKGFAERMHRQMATVNDPWEQICIFIEALIHFATSYPDHYSIIFLVRHPDEIVLAEREELGEEFLSGIQKIVRAILQPETPSAVTSTRVRQILCCLHGTAALLIAHPKAYGLRKQQAIVDCRETVAHLLGRD